MVLFHARELTKPRPERARRHMFLHRPAWRHDHEVNGRGAAWGGAPRDPRRTTANARVCSSETINRIEHGRACYPATIERIARALDLKPMEPYPEGVPGRAFQPQAGDAFRERRQLLGLSLRMCADAAGVSASTISRFERELRWQRYGARDHQLLVNEDFACILGFDGLAALQFFSVCGRDRRDDDDDDDDWENSEDD